MIRGPVVVVGMTRTGFALARALRARDPGLEVLGSDPDPDTAESAIASGAIAASVESPSSFDPGTSRIAIALPDGEAPRFLATWGAHLPTSAVVMDLSLLMLPSLQAASSVPELRGRFVPSHPVGPEEGDAMRDSADRFVGASVRIGGPVRAGEGSGAAGEAASFWRALGAEPHEIAPTLNDALVALTYHIPLFATAAVLRTLRRTGSMTRLYANDRTAAIAEMAAAADTLDERAAMIFRLNALKIVPALELLEREIRGLRHALGDAGDGPALERLLAEAREFRGELIA